MKSLLLSLLMTVAAESVYARTSTEGQIQKLKENAENSEHNYNQYQSNLEIVDRNIKQAGDAGKELDRLKGQLEKNVQNVDKNKQALTKLETDINGFKTAEKTRIAKDDEQIAQLKALLEKLEKNKKQRELNMLAYDKKLGEIQIERGLWDKQVEQMADLQKQIQQKKQLATTEKDGWSKKRKDYSGEAEKWKKESAEAKSQHQKYSQF